MDLVGFALLATVTGVGGGTLRDLVLGHAVFWLDQPGYVLLCALCSTLVFVAAPRIEYRYPVLLWADAVGLSVFAALGTYTTLEGGFSPVIAVLMGVMTATFGGLIRDVLACEIPLILRHEIYATAALIGAVTCAALYPFALPFRLAEIIGIAAGFATRAVALTHGLSLPRYRPQDARHYPVEHPPRRRTSIRPAPIERTEQRWHAGRRPSSVVRLRAVPCAEALADAPSSSSRPTLLIECSTRKSRFSVRDDLQVWQKLNVTAFLATGVSGSAPEAMGDPYVDGAGTPMPRCSASPSWILAADQALCFGHAARHGSGV